MSKITPTFFFLTGDDDADAYKEIVLANANLMSGQYVIIKDRAGKRTTNL